MSGGERLLLSAVAVIIFYVFVLVLLSFCVIIFVYIIALMLLFSRSCHVYDDDVRVVTRATLIVYV